jgi:hypothetical protein
MNLSAKQLDEQSSIKIDRWLDVHSDECKSIDDNREFTLHCLKLGMREPAFLFTDSRGYLWGYGKEGKYFPFHLEHGSKLIGLKLSAKASN